MATMKRVSAALLLALLAGAAEASSPPPAESRPTKVYVPYEQLRGVFESEKQGVFLPYAEFRRLWLAAQGVPAGVAEAPVPYLISTARFTGKVGAELASLQLELTLDILADGWVEVPIGLGEVAVAKAAFAQGPAGDTPLLRVIDGKYVLVARGKGRRTLNVGFVRQLVTEPGLNVLSFRLPAAAITTLELMIPEENMKVDVAPMLAAATNQVEADGKKATQLQAFLGSAESVRLSWKPRTQAAEELDPVVISDQFQHIDVAEAVISHEVRIDFDIRRRGVDIFTVQLPRDFRVVSVDGTNIARWEMLGGPTGTGPAASVVSPTIQTLIVRLFSPAKESYRLTVRMERFLKEDEAEIALTPVITQQALRSTGLIAITHSPRRSVELRAARELARVDIGRLPEPVRSAPGATAYRFITAEYGGVLAIGSVAPRINVHQLWALGVDKDRLELRGRLTYRIERAGVFELAMNLPEPWEIVSVGPSEVVDDHQLSGKGPARLLNLLLKREVTGEVAIDLVVRAPRSRPEEPVDLVLPLPAPAGRENIQSLSGQVMLFLATQFRAEVERLDQLQPLPLGRATSWTSLPNQSPALALEYQALDRARPAGARFRIAVKPAQVFAVVHRLVNIQPGSLEDEAVIQYRVLHAPVDTFYVAVPAELADQVRIQGKDIKEQPRIDALPEDQQAAPGGAEAATAPAGAAAGKRAYLKVVLQSPVIGTYELALRSRRPFQAGEVGKPVPVVVEPILAAGKLSDQSGHVAIAKADTLAIAAPQSENLIPGDPGSEADLPYAPHRRVAALAFKYTAPPFALTLPVVAQREADVFTRIATAAIIEQVIDREGTLNTHATFLLATSRGDRLPVRLPEGAKLFSVLLNGVEAAVEAGASPDQRIVRLPPSAGQVSKVVLEVSYGLDRVSARRLSGPELPEDIPVQQTLWRLWVPREDHLIAYDRTFAPVQPGQAEYLLGQLSAGQPVAAAFKLAPQGRVWDFTRQGPPGRLSVLLVGREAFAIGVWAVILGVGVAMLKLGGFQRCLIVLAALTAAAVVHLFAPLLVRTVLVRGAVAGAIVLLLWLSQWAFYRLPRRWRRPAGGAGPEAAAQAPQGKE